MIGQLMVDLRALMVLLFCQCRVFCGWSWGYHHHTKIHDFVVMLIFMCFAMELRLWLTSSHKIKIKPVHESQIIIKWCSHSWCIWLLTVVNAHPSAAAKGEKAEAIATKLSQWPLPHKKSVPISSHLWRNAGLWMVGGCAIRPHNPQQTWAWAVVWCPSAMVGVRGRGGGTILWILASASASARAIGFWLTISGGGEALAKKLSESLLLFDSYHSVLLDPHLLFV